MESLTIAIDVRGISTGVGRPRKSNKTWTRCLAGNNRNTTALMPAKAPSAMTTSDPGER